MTNTEKGQKLKDIRHRSQFASDFLDNIKNINEDEYKLVEMTKQIKFADIKNKKSGVTGEHLAVTDENGKVRISVKATNANNLTPEINDTIVGRMNVISVGTPGNNIQEVIQLLKRIND